MPRFINANLLRADFTGNFQEYYTVGQIRAMIDDVPTADVEEVKHGEWVQNPFCKPITTDFVVDHCRVYYCSECGRHIEDESSRPYEHFPYCHCGAKMDGKESNK